MADDIDDLLDECETKFCDSAGKALQKSPNKTSSISKIKKARNEDRSRRFWSAFEWFRVILLVQYLLIL